MNTVKNLLLALFSGMVLGGTAADLSAPAIIQWYNMPGGGQALCNCVDVVKSTAETLVKAQFYGALAGGVLFVVVSVVFGLARSKGKSVDPGAPAA